jgi:hypothetical protein
MMQSMKKRHEQKLVILSMILLGCFNLPLILLFESSDACLGFPVIYIYIFSIWLLSILVSFLIIRTYVE